MGHEELLDMVPMSRTTTGIDLYLCTEKSFENAHMDWSKLVSVTIDMASAMIGVNIRLVTKLQMREDMLCKDKFKSFQCIIHFVLKKVKIGYVMSVVIKTVNWIRSRALNH